MLALLLLLLLLLPLRVQLLLRGSAGARTMLSSAARMVDSAGRDERSDSADGKGDVEGDDVVRESCSADVYRRIRAREVL